MQNDTPFPLFSFLEITNNYLVDFCNHLLSTYSRYHMVPTTLRSTKMTKDKKLVTQEER